MLRKVPTLQLKPSALAITAYDAMGGNRAAPFTPSAGARTREQRTTRFDFVLVGACRAVKEVEQVVPRHPYGHGCTVIDEGDELGHGHRRVGLAGTGDRHFSSIGKGGWGCSPAVLRGH